MGWGLGSFLKNIRNFFRAGFFRKFLRAEAGERGEIFLRKYKKSLFLRKYKKFFNLRVRKFHFLKYKRFCFGANFFFLGRGEGGGGWGWGAWAPGSEQSSPKVNY